MKKVFIAPVLIVVIFAAAVLALSLFNSPSDCNGQWSNCANAFANDVLRASASLTSAATNKSSGWKNYSFNIAPGNQIINVTLRADYFSSLTNGYVVIKVSGNNGLDYGPPHTFGGNLMENSYIIDITKDRTWTPDMLSNGNFLVNVTCFKNGGTGKPICYLDWLPVNVTINDTTPFAAPNATPPYGYVSLGTTFNGNVVGGNPPFTYYWDFDDGTDSTEQSPFHTYDTTGQFNVSFTVIDLDGDSYIGFTNVTVGDFSVDRDPPNATVNAGGNATTTTIAMHLEGIPSLVTFSSTGCPPFSVCSFQTASGIASLTTTFSVATSPSTPPDIYYVNITATGNGNARTVVFAVIVV